MASADINSEAWRRVFGAMKSPYWSPDHPTKYVVAGGIYLPALAGFQHGSSEMTPEGSPGMFNLAWKSSGWYKSSDRPPVPAELQRRAMWAAWHAPMLRLAGKPLLFQAGTLSLQDFQQLLHASSVEVMRWNLTRSGWSNGDLYMALASAPRQE